MANNGHEDGSVPAANAASVAVAEPSPQSVGREFVRQYYTLLNQAPLHLHRSAFEMHQVIYVFVLSLHTRTLSQ